MALPAIYQVDAVPSIGELEDKHLKDLQAFASLLDRDVSLLAEEENLFTAYVASLKDKEAEATRVDDDEDDATAAQVKTGGKRKGRSYERKSSEQRTLLLSVEEKNEILQFGAERHKQEKDRTERLIDDSKEHHRATIEEATSRIKEIRMDMAYFKREVTSDPDTAAEKIKRFLEARPLEQEKQLKKLEDKSATITSQIQKSQTHMRQREDVGEAFHLIDFDQLKIENHQFTERIEAKNIELVDLKGTTTRTVQTLNGLMDKLGELMTQQAHFRKELRLRQEHVEKLTSEIEQVDKEFVGAQKKNTALKIQHESVKVPKVEEYIAQKAETYELQKAVQNWKRKVEIATGHMKVMKQQMITLRKKLGLLPQSGTLASIGQ